MTNEELDLYNKIIREEWYQTRPDIIKEAIRKLPPIRIYKFKNTVFVI